MDASPPFAGEIDTPVIDFLFAPSSSRGWLPYKCLILLGWGGCAGQTCKGYGDMGGALRVRGWSDGAAYYSLRGALLGRGYDPQKSRMA